MCQCYNNAKIAFATCVDNPIRDPAFVRRMATHDEWVPIPPYAELKARLASLQAEHVVICKQHIWASEELHETRQVAEQAVVQGRDREQVEALRSVARSRLFAHVKFYDDEKGQIENCMKAVREDMLDHDYMTHEGVPCSPKRMRHFRAMCDPFPVQYATQWAYEHLPSDVRAQRRARALERWRKGAYLLGILTFWTRVTFAPGGEGSRAALDRVSKRARTSGA